MSYRLSLWWGRGFQYRALLMARALSPQMYKEQKDGHAARLVELEAQLSAGAAEVKGLQKKMHDTGVSHGICCGEAASPTLPVPQLSPRAAAIPHGPRGWGSTASPTPTPMPAVRIVGARSVSQRDSPSGGSGVPQGLLSDPIMGVCRLQQCTSGDRTMLNAVQFCNIRLVPAPGQRYRAPGVGLGWQHGRSTAQHSTAQHSTAQHSTAQHSTAQHSTAQHSTAQHSTAHRHTHREAACARKFPSSWGVQPRLRDASWHMCNRADAVFNCFALYGHGGEQPQLQRHPYPPADIKLQSLAIYFSTATCSQSP